MNGKIKNKGIFRVSVYFNEVDLTAIAKDAEKAQFRRMGIPIKRQKPHGMADEWLANTDGIGQFLKMCYDYWSKNEPARLEAIAENERKMQELAAKTEALKKGKPLWR